MIVHKQRHLLLLVLAQVRFLPRGYVTHSGGLRRRLNMLLRRVQSSIKGFTRFPHWLRYLTAVLQLGKMMLLQSCRTGLKSSSVQDHDIELDVCEELMSTV